MTDKYHHGNLKQALIDAGIKIINESGEQALSIRKVATICGVSHSAPYAHFKDKDQLLSAIKASVTEQFTTCLKEAILSEQNNGAAQQIVAMGKAYVRFFITNPDYYNFLFCSEKIQAHLNPNADSTGDYPPFLLFKDLFEQYVSENHLAFSDEEKEVELIHIWASVQGICALIGMENVKTSMPWERLLDRLIK